MEQEQEKEVNNFIDSCDSGELCDFCTISEDCPKTIVCYGGEPIEPPCTGLYEKWIERHIDKEAIAEYLEGEK